MVQAVFDVPAWSAAEAALATLAAHDLGSGLARAAGAHVDAVLVHLCGYNQGLGGASPEWPWLDLRLRLSHERNHATDACL